MVESRFFVLFAKMRSDSNADVVKRLLPPFVRRIVHYREIDLQLTFSQLKNILVDPAAVSKAATFHQQTQGKWARDDPGFLVVLVCSVTITALIYFLALEPFTFFGFFFSILFAVVHFFVVAVLAASLGKWVATTYLRRPPALAEAEIEAGAGAPSSTVEWWYCFDVHCNSFFPYFLLTRIVQFPLLPILYGDSTIGMLLSLLLFAAAFGYYIYITFLGYFALPFLHNTEKFLLWYVIFMLAFGDSTIFM